MTESEAIAEFDTPKLRELKGLLRELDARQKMRELFAS
jgi:hypothetical protein